MVFKGHKWLSIHYQKQADEWMATQGFELDGHIWLEHSNGHTWPQIIKPNIKNHWPHLSHIKHTTMILLEMEPYNLLGGHWW